MRVIGEDGRQLGVIGLSEALAAADEAGLDLVEVSPDSNPPVARIVDYGKYKYQREKQQQKSRQKSKQLDLKQMRMGLKIGQHDLDIKLRKVHEFLEAGHKVKIMIVYRGRELAHRELGFKMAERIISEMLGEAVVVEQQPEFAGRQLSFTVRKK